MDKMRRPFPLVTDDEPIVSQARQMQLYENEDLINNIRGHYQDKTYSDRSIDESQSASFGVTSASERSESTYQEGENYAKLARETAREDVKRKRQLYLKNEVTNASQKRKSSSAIFKRPSLDEKSDSPEPVLETVAQELVAEKPKKATKMGWTRFTDKLHQDDYILVELPQTYQHPQNPSRKEPKKNSYDFLKRSQIYNQKERQENKERRVAQELNLTRFEADE
ncbi:hypothetical protein JOC28_002003 [Streptococcus loxodontisalivarius]|uniref:ATP-binding protein n=2 Tax=Streptococcus loxodontisalivarius TaxID=1349415 RepID=A0ABS2PUG2_9STRE|nr:hypothetical protein [Streptococcus loxodontisalivarius]